MPPKRAPDPLSLQVFNNPDTRSRIYSFLSNADLARCARLRSFDNLRQVVKFLYATPDSTPQTRYIRLPEEQRNPRDTLYASAIRNFALLPTNPPLHIFTFLTPNLFSKLSGLSEVQIRHGPENNKLSIAIIRNRNTGTFEISWGPLRDKHLLEFFGNQNFLQLVMPELVRGALATFPGAECRLERIDFQLCPKSALGMTWLDQPPRFFDNLFILFSAGKTYGHQLFLRFPSTPSLHISEDPYELAFILSYCPQVKKVINHYIPGMEKRSALGMLHNIKITPGIGSQLVVLDIAGVYWGEQLGRLNLDPLARFGCPGQLPSLKHVIICYDPFLTQNHLHFFAQQLRLVFHPRVNIEFEIHPHRDAKRFWLVTHLELPDPTKPFDPVKHWEDFQRGNYIAWCSEVKKELQRIDLLEFPLKVGWKYFGKA